MKNLIATVTVTVALTFSASYLITDWILPDDQESHESIEVVPSSLDEVLRLSDIAVVAYDVRLVGEGTFLGYGEDGRLLHKSDILNAASGLDPVVAEGLAEIPYYEYTVWSTKILWVRNDSQLPGNLTEHNMITIRSANAWPVEPRLNPVGEEPPRQVLILSLNPDGDTFSYPGEEKARYVEAADGQLEFSNRQSVPKQFLPDSLKSADLAALETHLLNRSE